jgi:hypothetical protein
MLGTIPAAHVYVEPFCAPHVEGSSQRNVAGIEAPVESHSKISLVPTTGVYGLLHANVHCEPAAMLVSLLHVLS